MLRITTRGRYALRAMLDLALHQGDSPVTREDIARRQELPATYLAQLFAALTRAGLVESVRGPGGGYVLGRPMEEITAGEIIRAVEGSIVPVFCVAQPARCQRSSQCTLRGFYEGLGRHIEAYLDHTTLAALCEAERMMGQSLEAPASSLEVSQAGE